MNLLDLCSENLIELNLDVKDKEDAIKKMAQVVYDNKYVTDLEGYIQNVLEREEELTTGFGNGLAMPHGKCAGVKKAALMIARFTQKIEWGSLDGEPVDIALLLAIPEESEDGSNIHLKMLTAIATKLGSTKGVEEIRQLDDKKLILNFLAN